MGTVTVDLHVMDKVKISVLYLFSGGSRCNSRPPTGVIGSLKKSDVTQHILEIAQMHILLMHLP